MTWMCGLRAATLGLIVASLTFVGTLRADALEDGAHKFIQALTDNALTSLAVKELSLDEREDRFRKLLNSYFDIDAIGKWVLGRHWRRANPDERKEYLVLFQNLIVKTYSRRFREYTGGNLDIEKASRLEDGTLAVGSHLDRGSSVPPLRVEWRMMAANGSYRVTDIVVEGVSLAQTTRSEFGSVIRSNGGKVAGLLKTLRTKNITLDRAAK